MTTDSIITCKKVKKQNQNVIFDSVYELLTKLCEKLLSGYKGNISNKLVKKYRSKAFDVLLSKKFSPSTETMLLENNSDPYCHLLAWEFVLINEYNLSEHAQKLQKCIINLQNMNSLSDIALSDVLRFLLRLCQLPDKQNISSSTTFTLEDKVSFRCFDSSMFSLSGPMICADTKYSDQSFLLKTRENLQQHEYLRAKYLENNICFNCNIPQRLSCCSLEAKAIVDDENKTFIEADDEDIWELVSGTEFTKRRTWETLGNPHPDKELPFLTEAPPDVWSDLYNIRTLNVLQLLGETEHKSAVIRPQKSFLSHVKDLLVGISSDSFKRDENGEMYLVSCVSVGGITTSAMESYCKDLILCSSCYTALNDLCNFRGGSEEFNRGFIFKELCDSISRYLGYYRLAIQNISEETWNLLTVHNYMRPLQSQLTVLASVCKVGPFTESNSLPNGVSLLNYLYQKTVELTEKEVVMVLYAVLYPCVQVYFNRFLQQWIFEGVVNDPYGEFFIVANISYVRTRGRTYWTRGHAVRIDMVPDFLGDLARDVLMCGKSVNLLKLCVPNSPLCRYLLGKKPNLLSCCLSADQVSALERDSSCYYLEAMTECGPEFRLSDRIAVDCAERDYIFASLTTRKRMLTIKRLELEKLKKAREEVERRRKAEEELRRQYDEALQNKKSQLIQRVEEEMKSNTEMLKIQSLREKLVAEEASNIIEYYDELDAISEQRRKDVQQHIDRLKKIDLEWNAPSNSINPHLTPVKPLKIDNSLDVQDILEVVDGIPAEAPLNEDNEEESSSTETFVSVEEEPAEKMETSVTSLDDAINANKPGGDAYPISETARIAAENFEMARRNRARVLSEVTGAEIEVRRKITKPSSEFDLTTLSELERNRLKVMSSEFYMRVADTGTNLPVRKETTSVEINRRRVMSTNECFLNDNTYKDKNANDPEVFFTPAEVVKDNGNNGEVDEKDSDERVEQKNLHNKSIDLKLDLCNLPVVSDDKPRSFSSDSIFGKFLKSPNFELDKPVPMSLGSTPCIESTPDINLLSGGTTAATNFTDEGFDFEDTNRDVTTRTEPVVLLKGDREKIVQRAHLSKRVSVKDAGVISTRAIKIFIQQSVSIPVNTQNKLVNNQLLRYFFDDLELLVHLNSLRNYFFLLDGEFGRNITEGLFEKLYDVRRPVDLINYRTLQHLVYNAMDSSIKQQRNSARLSFRINSLPDAFNLEDPEALECLSLSYKVSWPLNILLPSDAVAKYDDVFKFLLKLNRALWVLKKIMQDLKLLSKKCGSREPYLALSPQFQRLHQYRHVMTHFVQTLRNYVVGEVLHTSWSTFERKLLIADNIDDVYQSHVAYIKNILFMCLLNERSLPIRKLILKIFTVVFKFYHYLRASDWAFDEDLAAFEHPHFKKLEDIFRNMEELVAYFVKVARKVAKVGYQPHLIQLLEMLNVNDYYVSRSNFSRSQSNSSALGNSL